MPVLIIIDGILVVNPISGDYFDGAVEKAAGTA
jgi:hypothetical protein